jgi:hypothetical protein
MRAINNVSIGILSFLLIFLLNGVVYTQDDIKECKSYESLYNTIKSGKPAAYNKTSFINEFSLVEKSIVTIIPNTSPDSSFKVIFKITNLEKGKKKDSYDIGSVLGFMVSGCKNFEKKYNKFVGTSCSLYAETPEDARSIAEDGISFSVDQKYVIDGDLVLMYEKVCKQERPEHQPVKKPAVYLYPLEELNIKVKVEVNGKLTLTEPLYGNGWDVNATPDGLIDNKFDYLFYEADLNRIELPEEGWIVEFKELEKWFDDYLPQLGLNTKEKEQFKEYWLKNLKKSNYYEIKLLDNKFLEENMKLKISPEPQTLIRLNFYFKPSIEKRELKKPSISTPERKGFTVVEWGGINAGDLKILP